MRKGPIKKKPKSKIRGAILLGKTTRYRLGSGNVYITVNVDKNGEPYEMFTNIGKAGGRDFAMAEGLSRMISISLQEGVPIKKVIKQLEHISCGDAQWNEGVMIKSVCDAIAKTLIPFTEKPLVAKETTHGDRPKEKKESKEQVKKRRRNG